MKEGEICRDNVNTGIMTMNLMNHRIVTQPLRITDHQEDMTITKKSMTIEDPIHRNDQLIEDEKAVIHVGRFHLPEERILLEGHRKDMNGRDLMIRINQYRQERDHNVLDLSNKERHHYKKPRNLRIVRFSYSCTTCSFTH